MESDRITSEILNASIALHRELGPGLLESVYEAILWKVLESRGLRVRRQQPIRFEYGGIVFDDGFRVDLLVEDTVLVELKSVAKLDGVHARQLLTYLRLMNLPVGLLINFGGETLKEGVKRVVNGFPPASGGRLFGPSSSAPHTNA